MRVLGVGTFRKALVVWVLSVRLLFPAEPTDLIKLTLPEAIERTLQHNEEVRIAQEDVRQSKAAFGQARGPAVCREWISPLATVDRGCCLRLYSIPRRVANVSTLVPTTALPEAWFSLKPCTGGAGSQHRGLPRDI